MENKARQEKLLEILKLKKCFKLVCGAGNEDLIEVEKLVAVYAKAGANYFDLSPRQDVVGAAQKALKRVITPNRLDEYFLNVSVGLPGDPHARKALINPNTCLKCGACQAQCLQNAITENVGLFSVLEQKCIGCGRCGEICPAGAINFEHKNKNLKETLKPLIEMGIDSIELHASTDDEPLVREQIKIINELFKGPLSVCLDRSKIGDNKLIERIKKIIKERDNRATIIQADGAPMSGSKDDFNTTLQAVATADIVQKANLPVFILLSGGTNSKTTELARLCGVNAHGVSIGSYARKIIKEYIQKENFLDDSSEFEKAVAIAKELIDKTLINKNEN
jgi:Fe-S-cluster-containing hydrogenase component 2